MLTEPTTLEETMINFHPKYTYINNIYIYKLPKEYNYINVKYITEDKEIIEIIKNTKTKSIVFASSIKMGEWLNNNLSDSVFIKAENKNLESKKVVKELINTSKFSKKVLIATSVLDVGVNISDENIENVIIAHTEETEFLQMLGRIREIQSSQKISLYIYQRNEKYFKNLLNKTIDKKVECCEYLELYGDLNEVLKEELKSNSALPNDYKKFLYLKLGNNNKYNVYLNKLAPYYWRQLYNLYNRIYEEIKKDKNYFIKNQLKWLKQENTFANDKFYYLDLKESYMQKLQEAIKREAENIKGGISKYDCAEMLKKFKPIINDIDTKFMRSDAVLSIKTFNRFCELYNIPYYVAKKEKKVNRKTMYYLAKIDSGQD